MYRIALIIILLITVYAPAFISMAQRFTAADSYYSHGFLVPLVSIYFIWQKRKKLRTLLPVSSSKFGLILLSAGLLLHFASTALKINFGSYASLPIVLGGLVLYLFGKKITREILSPLAFLIFMIPLPTVTIITITFKMKILTARIASGIVNMVGIPAIRDGSTIYLPRDFLIVGDPCSGLRSLISLLALGAIFAQLIPGSRVKKSILFLSTIPIAIISNASRIVLLLLVTYIYGKEAAMGFFHDFSGMLVFAFAFIGLIIVMRFLKCRTTKPV